METQFRVEWDCRDRVLPPHEDVVWVRAASAPSLRQCELDQVHRVTALRGFAVRPSVSQPLVETPRVSAPRLRRGPQVVNLRSLRIALSIMGPANDGYGRILQVQCRDIKGRSTPFRGRTMTRARKQPGLIGFDVEGDADNSYGYLYKPDGDFEAISADLFAIEAPMGAYLRSVYEDGPYPLKLLLQFDRNSGRFNIDFEDKNPNRWAVTPVDIYGFIESLRPKFEP